MLSYAKTIGGPALRKMTFHQRARMIKALALYLGTKKELFYKLSYSTGATKIDSWIDIEGGIGNLFVYASKGRRELPDETFLMDGNQENISKNGTLIGIKYPNKVKLSSEGLPNNGFMVEKWFSRYSMYIQSMVKDEDGYIWTVTVGKDAFSDDYTGLENGRIYVVIQDPKHIKPSWYFTIKTFGGKK
jgi:hypothetical protein